MHHHEPASCALQSKSYKQANQSVCAAQAIKKLFLTGRLQRQCGWQKTVLFHANAISEKLLQYKVFVMSFKLFVELL